MRLIVFLRLLWCDVNKSRNRQSQSRRGAVIPHHADNVLQPMPRDAFPWLFSVNSAVSRPSILVGHWCHSKAFNVSLPPQTFTVLRFKGGKTTTERNVCLLHTAKTPHLPFDYRCNLVRAMSKPCIRELHPDDIWEESFHMLNYLLHADLPLFLFCDSFIIAHSPTSFGAAWQDGPYPCPSMAARELDYFDGKVALTGGKNALSLTREPDWR